MDPLFRPPLHKQRHQFVVDLVKRTKPKRVADLGCAECTLLKKLKFNREIELLVGVDLNGAKVKKKRHGLAPLSTDYLQPTYDQLRIELYQGSVTEKDSRLRGFDLVTSIELIEHLSLADVRAFSYVVFGYMTPLMVVISTPNSEFNHLLPGLVGFRHSDHKFEWTRAEFKSWALNICLDFGYVVEFTGVGQAPSGQQDQVGFCSQIGVFHRLGGRDGCMLFGDDTQDVFSYTLLFSINYPSLRDNNILRCVLVSEVVYWLEKLRSSWTEQETDETVGVFTPCQTGGEEVEQLSVVSPSPSVSYTAACEHPMEQFRGGKGQQIRCVSVPLTVLWSCCQKVRALSGSLDNLRHLLMDEPKVNLTQDGSAVLLDNDQQDLEDDYNNLDDSGYAEASHCSYSTKQEEDWEAHI